MAKTIMIQGTMSNVGKSILAAGLCRVFRQDGYQVAPFKSQNMALNSFITQEGLEMGRAQAVQAEACGIEPSVLMNPILLKPVTDMGSQVIVNGEVIGNMKATEYFALKPTLAAEVMRAFATLSASHDIIVLEGAGSPAEINLKKDDIVNMGMAQLAQAPVLLVGDIDRGGVFAQLAGTLMLLNEEERRMVKATVINKFRGDMEILRPGLSMLQDITDRPVAGVLPYLQIDIDDEDSLTERFHAHRRARIDIAVIRLPRISNFTDFTVLEATEGVAVRYIASVRELGKPDMVILPGTKSTISDLQWLRQCGLEAAIKKLAASGTIVFGICGGYQMLGERITDAEGTEGGGSIAGMALLPDNGCMRPTSKRKSSARGLPAAYSHYPVPWRVSAALWWKAMKSIWAGPCAAREQIRCCCSTTALKTAVSPIIITAPICMAFSIPPNAERPSSPPWLRKKVWMHPSLPHLITRLIRNDSTTRWRMPCDRTWIWN